MEGSCTQGINQKNQTAFADPGEQFDPSTGLYYLRARYYDPATGRFTQRDPFPGWVIWPDTLNAYPYVLNNPVNWVDPSGEFGFIPLLAAGLLGGFIGGVGYYTLETFMKADVCLGVQWDLLDALKGGLLGAGIGALLGSGLYGGWWAGMHLGWWGGGAATTAATEALAAAKTAESVADKLTRYLLNPNHPRGSTMATWYEKALGFTRENLGDLARQIVFDPKNAYVTEVTQFGTKYNQKISITGANGKVIDIIAAWIKLADGTIKLVTTVPGK